MHQENKGHKKGKGKKISLKPFEFDEAVSDLLKVKPEPEAKSEPKTKE